MDIVEKSEVKADQIDKGDVKEVDTLAGKYINKARRNVSKTFLKRALNWSFEARTYVFYTKEFLLFESINQF